MNRQIFNLFLIALLAFTIIVNAHNHHHNNRNHHNHHHNDHKICQTVTVTESCMPKRRHYRDDRHNCKATKSVTITPTV